jgi:integrase
MPVYKDKNRGTWYVDFRYKDYADKWQRKKKRGFITQRDAKAWEREFLSSVHTAPEMTFRKLADLYLDDCKPRTKKTTHYNKVLAFKKHIIPFFGDMPIENIKPLTVRQWQTELLSSGLKNTTISYLHSRLSAVFNYAVKFHGLQKNPARDCGNVGGKSDVMQFWMVDDFKLFSVAINERSYPCYVMFTVMFWTGIRKGEAMALTPADFDFKKRTLRINKTFSVVDGEHLITKPKTKKSIRTIDIPAFLCELVNEYISKLYGINSSDRIFTLAHRTLTYHFDNAIAAAGVKRIRMHDLRHSHASMLINNNVPILYISERLGHESVKVTLDTYAHLYPDNKAAVMDLLTSLNAG